MSHVQTSHPELETLAAFADGRLTGAERIRVIEHLASCDDCLEVVVETAEVQEELDEEASSPGTVLRHPGVWRRWMPAVAAAAVLVLAVGGLWQFGWLLGPDLSVDTLAARLEQAPARLGDAWQEHGWPQFRGGEASIEERRAAFRTGVLAVDLQLALRTGERERALGFVRALVDALTDIDYTAPTRASYRRLVIEPLEGGEPLAGIAREAAEQDHKNPALIDELYYELGKWAETGRMAALAGDREALRNRSFRAALQDFQAAWAADKAGGEPRREIAAELGRIDRLLQDELDEQSLGELRGAFGSIVAGSGVRLRENAPSP